MKTVLRVTANIALALTAGAAYEIGRHAGKAWAEGWRPGEFGKNFGVFAAKFTEVKADTRKRDDS